jgi:SAM-dependent methyltransferase
VVNGCPTATTAVAFFPRLPPLDPLECIDIRSRRHEAPSLGPGLFDAPPRMARFNRLPQLADWENESYKEALDQLHLEGYHNKIIDRSDWQKAHCLLAMEEIGVLRPGASGLVVAAGIDPLLFVLSNQVASVVAVDLYNGKWLLGRPDFPNDPSRYDQVGGNPARLTVLRMDARTLGFRSEAFDFAVCIGPSINWFGGVANALRALREMERVVKRGGVLFTTIELAFRGPRTRRLFDLAQIEQDLLGKTDLEPIEPIDDRLGDLAAVRPITAIFRHPPPGPDQPYLILKTRRASFSAIRPTLFVPLFLALRRPQQ